MKKSTKFIAFTLLAGGLFISSCKKGDTGPAGEQGAAGTNGTNGKDGNANVKSTTVFINANEWIYTSGEAKVTKLIPEITADIVNKGAVQIYSEGSTSSQWEALPTTYADPSLILTMGYTIEAGKLYLLATYNSSVTLPAGTIANSNFKIVTIAGAAKVANPGGNTPIPSSKVAILN